MLFLFVLLTTGRYSCSYIVIVLDDETALTVIHLLLLTVAVIAVVRVCCIRCIFLICQYWSACSPVYEVRGFRAHGLNTFTCQFPLGAIVPLAVESPCGDSAFGKRDRSNLNLSHPDTLQKS